MAELIMGDPMVVIDADAHVIETEETSSTEVDAISVFKQADAIPPETVQRVLCDNPARLYGLDPETGKVKS
jgi:hypothetical protein